MQHGVSIHDASRPRVERRPIQRMRHRADKAGGHPSRQTRVGIERDHVPDGVGHGRGAPVGRHERRIGGGPEKTVQFAKLPALAFPPHPLPFVFIPCASPVQ